MKKLQGILLTTALLVAGGTAVISHSVKSKITDVKAAVDWTDSTRLPSKSEMGDNPFIKLQTDVVLHDRWSAETTRTYKSSAGLDLNGHSIYVETGEILYPEYTYKNVMEINRYLEPFTISDSNPNSVHYVSYDPVFGRVNKIQTTPFEGSTEIKGGVMCGGYSASMTGGIAINDTQVYMSGGTITGCSTSLPHGASAIYTNYNGADLKVSGLEITGGRIYKNTIYVPSEDATPQGAAIVVTNKCPFQLKGGVIEENEGGGILVKYVNKKVPTFDLYQSGKPVIRNNTFKGADRNIVLENSLKINIKEKLTNTEPYGITCLAGTGIVTNGLNGKGSLANFASDNPDCQLILENNEVKVVPKKVVTYDANGGTGSTVDPNKYEDGAKAEILDNAFTAPEGKAFTGWNTQADGTGDSYFPGQEVTLHADLTLYAQWGKPIVVNVPSPAPNYDGEGHSNVIEVTDPAEGYVVKYGEIAGNYNLDDCPSYTDVGEYEVYYKVSADGYADLVGSFTINIKENDKSELNSLIQEAEALIAKIKELDPELAAQLQEALDNAKKTSEDKNVTTSKIEEAIHGLQVQITKADEVENKKSGIPGWAIALIVVGSLLAVCGIAYCLLFFVFNRWIAKEGKAVRVFVLGHKEGKARAFVFPCKLEYHLDNEIFKTKEEALKH